MNFKMRLLDGYVSTVSDGYNWVTQWQELNDYGLYSVSIVFVGGTPSGTITLEQSNDIPSPIGIGGNKPFPKSAGSLYGSPLDVSTVPSSSTAVSGTGVYELNYQLASYGWVRVKYANSGGTGTTVSVFFCGRSV